MRTRSSISRSLPPPHTVSGRTARSIKEIAILFRQMRFGCAYIESDTETRAVPNVDESALHNRVGQALDDVIPPFRLAKGVLERNVVLRQRGGHMHVGSDTD